MRIKRQMNRAARYLLGCCLVLLLGLWAGVGVYAAEPSRDLFEEVSGDPAESGDTAGGALNGSSEGTASETTGSMGLAAPGSGGIAGAAGALSSGTAISSNTAFSSEATASSDVTAPSSAAGESVSTGYGGGHTASIVSSEVISSSPEVPAAAIPTPPQEEASGSAVWISLVIALLLLLANGGLFVLILRSIYLLRQSVNDLKREQKKINGNYGELSQALHELSLQERSKKREETAFKPQPQDMWGTARSSVDSMYGDEPKRPNTSALQQQPYDKDELKQMLPTISQYYQKQAISESDIDTDATFWEIDQDEVVKARYSDSESNIERTRFVPSQMNRKNANFILVSKGNYRYMLPNWLKYHGDSAVIRRKLIEQNVEWYFDFIQQDRRIRLNNGSSYRIEGVSRGAVVLPPNDDYCGLKMKGCIEVTEIK